MPINNKPFLDDIEQHKEIDKSHYFTYINDIPNQCRLAYTAISTMEIPDDYKQVKQIVICGMGGSAIGADLARALLPGDLKIPVVIHRDYELSAYIGPSSLVVLSSFSGETEETLSSFYDALAKKAKMFVISGGGTLVKLAKENNIPFYHFSYPNAVPRTTVGFVFSAITTLLEKINAFHNSPKLFESLNILEQVIRDIDPEIPTNENSAKLIAYTIFDQMLIVVGSGILAPVARRWKCQFNENSKSFAALEYLPELDHNTVEGLHFPKKTHDAMIFILLENSFDHPQIKKRYSILKELFNNQKVAYMDYQAVGDTIIVQKLSSVIFGDYVSYYLALLNKIDPTPVDTIQWAKKRLK